MGVALRPQQSRGSRRGGAAMVDAREQAGARGSGGLPKGRKKMTGGSEGKIVFYIFTQLKNDYYTRYGVLKTKSRFHNVLQTKLAFMMCSTQNHSLRVCCIQISHKSVTTSSSNTSC